MKNLKMFAIALLSMLVMVCSVHATEGEVTAIINGKTVRYDDIAAAFTAAANAEKNSSVTITLTDDDSADTFTISAAPTLAAKVSYTINLNGHTLVLAKDQQLTVADGQTLIIAGEGTVESADTANWAASTPMFVLTNGATFKTTGDLEINSGKTGFMSVTGGSKVTTVEIAKGTTVDTTTGIAVSGNGVALTVAGKLVPDDDALVLTAGTSAKPTTVAISGEVTPDAGIAVDVQGYAEVTVTGTVTSEDDDAIKVSGSADAAIITVDGGTITAETDAKYAINLAENKAIVKVTKGTLTSGDEEPAIYFTDEEGLEANKGNIISGTFNYGLVKDVSAKEGGKLENEYALKLLVGEASYTVDEKTGAVVVAAKADDQQTPSDQPTNPGDSANTPEDGTTGRLPDQPAKTNDNILVYASLGLVSALTVGFSARRKENN